MWSLGVIIYILLCGYPPFYPSQPTRKGIDKTMKKRIASAEFEFPQEEWALVSDNAKDLITGLVTFRILNTNLVFESNFQTFDG